MCEAEISDTAKDGLIKPRWLGIEDQAQGTWQRPRTDHNGRASRIGSRDNVDDCEGWENMQS
jgi:hypothetical protein